MHYPIRNVIFILAICAVSRDAVAQNSFSFQGQLHVAGVPANGDFDFKFRLMNAAEGGSNVGTSIGRNPVSVVNGLFQVELDWDRSLFASGPRWLEISVRTNNRQDYTVLLPRTPVTAAPVALYALSADGSSAGGSLDHAYDFGGAGTGRVITADAGRVEVRGPDGFYSEGGVVGGAGRVGLPTADFDVEARQSFNLQTGDPPAPATVGGIIRSGTIVNPVEKWTYLRTATVGNAIRRNIGSSLAFDVEGSINNAGLWITQMMLDEDGNLGVGTPVPSTRLHVIGNSDSELADGGYLTLGNTSSINLSLDPDEIMARNNGGMSTLYLNDRGGNVAISGTSTSGYVGIGTRTPSARLHIVNFTDAELIQNGAIVLGSTGSTNITIDNNEIMARNNGSTAPLYINNSGGNVLFGGAVGIGTSNPAELLHVNGTASVNVLKITGGADLSERFELTGESPEPGTVVVIDPSSPGKLIPSSTAYDRAVAGVISGAGGVATGMLMGHEGTPADGSHPVALTGRVYCLVDATGAAVKPGDLLTTSNTSGHAMKAVDRSRTPGAVLGKAMTALEEGQKGLVLVLVALQ